MSKDSKTGILVDAGVEGTRIQEERMRQIYQALASGQKVNCSRMAKLMEVDRRTIHRDLDFMRDRLNLPIDYNSRERSYFFTKPVKQKHSLIRKPIKVLPLAAWDLIPGKNPVGHLAMVQILTGKITFLGHVANGRMDIGLGENVIHLLQKEGNEDEATAQEMERANFNKVGKAYWIEDDLDKIYDYLNSVLARS